MGRLQKLGLLMAVKTKYLAYIRAAAKSEMLKANAEYQGGTGGERGGRTNANTTEGKLMAYVEASKTADAARAEWKTAEGRALQLIAKQGKELHAVVLQMYYVDFMTVEAIAAALHYSSRQIWRLKKKAEQAL